MLNNKSSRIKKTELDAKLDKAKQRRSIPLRLIMVVPFVVQIFAVVGLVGYLSYRNGQRAINDLALQLMGEINNRIDREIDSQMDRPRRVLDLNLRAIEAESLDLTNFEITGRQFWHQVETFNFAAVSYGNQANEFIGAGYYQGEPYIAEVKKNHLGILYNYPPDRLGNRGVLTTLEADPNDVAAYDETIAARKTIWSSIYSWNSDPNEVAIALSTPLFQQGNITGVLSIDITLIQLRKFLQGLKVSKSGKTAILDSSGQLVADSTAQPLYKLDPANKLQRLQISDSQDEQLQAAGQFLKGKFPDFRAIKESQQLVFENQGQQLFLLITPYRDQFGLDWRIMTIVPESDFMEQINVNTRNTILLSLLALVVAAISGIYTSRWILSPIDRLNQASQEIAKGNLNQQIQPENIQELDRLGRTFNEMSQQIQAAFSFLENTNTELEQRVAERTEELQTAKQLADNANQAKSEFLANMSHELRTPLNGILGYAQILGRSKVIPEKERHGVNIIHQCGSHLLTLINDVLDISKIEARKLELTPNAVHLPALLQEVVEISQIRAQQKSLNFHYTSNDNLPDGVIVDEKRLRQVLINLLGNAIKFTDRGNVTFRVDRLNATTEKFVHLRFAVTDTGVGITEEDVQKLFRAFEQVGDKSRQSEGTGLGLAISQQIVQLMGGQIQVNSQLGVGSEFFFEVALPLHDDWVQQQNRGESIIGYEGTRKKILVVDDRWENRSVIANLLEPLGFIVTEAEHGQDGLAKMRELQPDLVITDLAMPVMDGFEMLKHLRQAPDLQHLTVVVSSASVSQTDQQMSLDAGGDDFLAKPLHSQDLFNTLAKYLNLTWNYQQEEPLVSAINLKSIALNNLVAPNSEDLQILLELAQEGRLKKLRQLGAEIAARDQSYKPFVDHINDLAKQFQSEKIEEFIQQSIQQSLNAKNSS